MSSFIRKTRSVCPVCLKNIEARLIMDNDGSVLMEKNCSAHGDFRVPVWHGKLNMEQ